jgi:hypothetical protein
VPSRLTALIIVAVLGVGLAAAVDALPDEDDEVSTRVERAADIEEAAAALQQAGMGGVITYSDERCRLHAVRLPRLEPAPAPSIRSCEPHIPTGGIGTWKGDVVWAGFGFGTVQIVLSSELLTKEIRRHPASRPTLAGQSARVYRAVQAVALADGAYAVLVDARRASPLLAIFEGAQLIFLLPPSWVGERDELRASPLGTYFAVMSTRPRSFRVFTRNGDSIVLPDEDDLRAIAWSPDERWTALASRSSVLLFPSAEPGARVIRIPLAVRDLDWDA